MVVSCPASAPIPVHVHMPMLGPVVVAVPMCVGRVGAPEQVGVGQRCSVDSDTLPKGEPASAHLQRRQRRIRVFELARRSEAEVPWRVLGPLKRALPFPAGPALQLSAFRLAESYLISRMAH